MPRHPGIIYIDMLDLRWLCLRRWRDGAMETNDTAAADARTELVEEAEGSTGGGKVELKSSMAEIRDIYGHDIPHTFII